MGFRFLRMCFPFLPFFSFPVSIPLFYFIFSCSLLFFFFFSLPPAQFCDRVTCYNVFASFLPDNCGCTYIYFTPSICTSRPQHGSTYISRYVQTKQKNKNNQSQSALSPAQPSPVRPQRRHNPQTDAETWHCKRTLCFRLSACNLANGRGTVTDRQSHSRASASDAPCPAVSTCRLLVSPFPHEVRRP